MFITIGLQHEHDAACISLPDATSLVYRDDMKM